MIGVLLDTSTISYLVDRSAPRHSEIAARFAALAPEVLTCVSILTVYEAALVVDRVPALSNLARFFESRFQVMPLPVEGAAHFGRLKTGLASRWGVHPRALSRHNVDLMIAASALALDLAVVSNDSIFRDLAEIDPRLTVEDWTS